MTEREFIRFYKKRNFSKNQKEAKEKIDLFWDALLKALEEEKVVIKNWGTFELKEVKSRKVMIPKLNKVTYTKEKKTIKFRAGSGLRKRINEFDTDEQKNC